MSEDLELQTKIAQLAGRINRHKTTNSPAPSLPSHSPTYKNDHSRGITKWAPQRGTPYGNPRGRGGRGRSSVHRNRTLVLTNTPPQQNGNGDSPSNSGTSSNEQVSASGWVSKRDRHMQLINNSVFEQKSLARTKAIEETEKQRIQNRNNAEKLKISNYLRNSSSSSHLESSSTLNPVSHQINVEGVNFLVVDGGSKLIKVKDEQNSHTPTPKKANIGGVQFFRSKHGNLYRAGLVKTKRRATEKVQELCPRFTATGTCSKGPNCRFVHDPSKVAICKDFLLTGKCQAGVDCDLSHDPTPERTPACLHFQRGNCTNSECRYTHVRTTPGAFVCKTFATLGYCSKGSSCTERHIHECPDYANKGFCRNKKCRLPHVDRAGQLRKAASIENHTGDDDISSDVSSDDEWDHDSEDVDSDEIDEEMPALSNVDDHSISQQNDFVEF